MKHLFSPGILPHKQNSTTVLLRSRVFFAILVLLLFSACRVGQVYKTPALVLPERFETAVPHNTTDTVGIAGLPYHRFFNDPALLALIDSAVTGNFDLQLAIKKMEYAEQTLKQAKLGNLPTASLQVGANINRPSNNSLNGLSTSQFLGSGHIEDYSASLNLSWEADIWGKIRSRKEAALASYLQTQEAMKTVRTQLVSDVAQGFYNLLMLDEQLAVTRRSLVLYDSTLYMTRLQKAAGQVTALAVEQTESQRQAAALSVPQLEQRIALQENALRILCGKLPGAIERRLQLNTFSIDTALATGIPAEMVRRRPDIREAELALVAANAQANVAQASMYPSLTITAQGGVDAFKASKWFSIPGSLFGTAAGSIAQPLFQQRQLKTQFEQAKIQRDQFAIQFRQTVLNAVGDVSNALVKINKLLVQERLNTERIDTLQTAVRNARLLFSSGMANYLEVITAQSNALQAELNQADIKRQELSAAVDLYRSLGGGWE